MIVKTGANYQNDGGYIEASVSNGMVRVNTENKKIETVLTSTEAYVSIVNGSILLESNIHSGSVNIPRTYSAGDKWYSSGSMFTIGQKTDFTSMATPYFLIISPSTSGVVTANLELQDDSVNCEYYNYSNSYGVVITGDDFYIHLKEKEV